MAKNNRKTSAISLILILNANFKTFREIYCVMYYYISLRTLPNTNLLSFPPEEEIYNKIIYLQEMDFFSNKIASSRDSFNYCRFSMVNERSYFYVPSTMKKRLLQEKW